jgi:phosphoribosylaminoimidazole-succinocarboxamide synthase
MSNGFMGQEGQAVPDMTDDYVKSVSDRYIELYERITGRGFVPADTSDIAARIQAALEGYLG